MNNQPTKKLTKQQVFNVIVALLLPILSVLVTLGYLAPDEEPTARGTTNFSSVALSGDLTVGDDATVTGDLTVTNAAALPSGSVDATEIANVTRQVNFPLRSFVECATDAGTDINFAEAADALPDFINSATDGTGFVLRFDDTGGQEDEATEVCNQFSVPADYASGGAFIFRALKNAETATESENINCAVSVNGAALQATGVVTITAAATASYTCTPTISALVANDSVSFYFAINSIVGGAEAIDDTVDIASVKFSYTATQ